MYYGWNNVYVNQFSFSNMSMSNYARTHIHIYIHTYCMYIVKFKINFMNDV
jgi:hypothetical protein